MKNRSDNFQLSRAAEQDLAKEIPASIVLPAINRLEGDFEIAASAPAPIQKIENRSDACRPRFATVQHVIAKESRHTRSRSRPWAM